MTAAEAAADSPRTPHAQDRAGPEPPMPRSFEDVPGWFYRTDAILFDWFLARQSRLSEPGDLLEMGAYLGKSAVMMRAYLRPGEDFTVCDLFDSEAPDEDNGQEMRGSYSTLTRRAFERNFLSFHDDLPRIVQAPTSVVPEEVAEGSCRFVHVDASHLYEHVRLDIAAARHVLGPDGLVVLDDYRSEHTPGVACATWQAVLDEGLRPLCVSGHKFYGTWGDPEPWQDALHADLRERRHCWLQWQQVAGHRILLVGARNADAPELPVSRHAAPVPAVAGRPRGAGPPLGRRLRRRLAADWLPPAVTRTLVRVRDGRRRA